MSPRKVLISALVAMLLSVGAVLVWERRTLGLLYDNWDVLSEGAEWVGAAKDPEALIGYLAAHPDRVSIATWAVGAEDQGYFHDADRPRPLASTVKILVLAAWARQVADGALSPDERVSMESWEALHLPRTDGGAHEAALAALNERKAIVDGSVPLSEVARAMIVHSDNAATDLLMQRLGREVIESTPKWLGLEDQEAPWPLNGTMLIGIEAPGGDEARVVEEWAGKPRQAIADEAWRRSLRQGTDVTYRKALQEWLEGGGAAVDVRGQLAFADVMVPRGTARGYARLMERVLVSGDRWGEVMAAPLEWVLEEGPTLRQRFDRLGTKGGSLTGVLTSAAYAQTRSGERRVAAVFHQQMPMKLWGQLLQRFTHQDLVRRALEEPTFAADLKQRLSVESGQK